MEVDVVDGAGEAVGQELGGGEVSGGVTCERGVEGSRRGVLAGRTSTRAAWARKEKVHMEALASARMAIVVSCGFVGAWMDRSSSSSNSSSSSRAR